MKSFSKNIPLKLVFMEISVKVACTSREVGYDFMLVVKQVINIQCQSHYFSESNGIPSCPERRSESVAHMLRNARACQGIGCSWALEIRHPENVLF